MKNKLSLAIGICLLCYANICPAQRGVGDTTTRRISRKPNIIFILTDDQRWDAMGVMGNPLIRTPNLDQLASKGILFRNAYVTTSICCVSRASLLTGQYQSRHHINDFDTDLSEGAFSKTYPYLLKENGYQIGFIGKFGVGHHPPEKLYDYWVNTEAGGKSQPDYLMIESNGNRIHDTDTIGHAIQRFLDQVKTYQPFCLSISFKAPHEQDGIPPVYIVQDRYKDLYSGVTIPVPLTAEAKYWNTFPDFFRTDQNLGRARWKGFLSTPELFQKNVKDYYRLLTGVDEVVGELTTQLKKIGIDQNTIIIYMGDNGMMLGEHGMEGKWYGYEESIRVPLLIYDPLLNIKSDSRQTQQIALNIDIAPTILNMAGLQVPLAMQGIDLVAQLENKSPERKEFFYQHYFLGSPELPKVEGVAGGEFKYMKYIEHDYEELFNVLKDPHETTNLAGNIAYRKQLEALRKKMILMKKQSN